VTNPTDVTGRKKARKCKTGFLPGHGEGNCRVTNPDITEELGGLSLRALDQPVPEGGVEEHQRPVRSAKELLIKKHEKQVFAGGTNFLMS
jgi:hypothetical protein